MATTEWDIRNQARRLADAYATLHELSQTPPRPIHVRTMKPMFRSQSPTADNDYALNLEIELMRDTPDDTIPGGLRTMACDALSYTTATGYAHDAKPGILCNHISFHAQTIAADFPAADDLLELMEKQEDYIRRAISKRWGEPQKINRELAEVKPTGYGTAADIAQLVSAILGRTITRKQITYWARTGRITKHTKPDGTTAYELGEAVEAARNYRDTRRRTPLDQISAM